MAWGWVLKRFADVSRGTGLWSYLASKARDKSKIELEKTRTEGRYESNYSTISLMVRYFEKGRRMVGGRFGCRTHFATPCSLFFHGEPRLGRRSP